MYEMYEINISCYFTKDILKYYYFFPWKCIVMTTNGVMTANTVSATSLICASSFGYYCK
jgi:hypothetical protein